MSKYLLFSFSFLFVPFFLDSPVAINLFIFRSPSFFFFFSSAFFFSSLGVELFFFFFLFLLLRFLFFFFPGGPCVDSCISSFISFLFLLGAPFFFLLVFGVAPLSCFLLLEALCFLSPLASPELAA